MNGRAKVRIVMILFYSIEFLILDLSLMFYLNLNIFDNIVYIIIPSIGLYIITIALFIMTEKLKEDD